jgi:hypothetical protein
MQITLGMWHRAETLQHVGFGQGKPDWTGLDCQACRPGSGPAGSGRTGSGFETTSGIPLGIPLDRARPRESQDGLMSTSCIPLGIPLDRVRPQVRNGSGPGEPNVYYHHNNYVAVAIASQARRGPGTRLAPEEAPAQACRFV